MTESAKRLKDLPGIDEGPSVFEAGEEAEEVEAATPEVKSAEAGQEEGADSIDANPIDVTAAHEVFRELCEVEKRAGVAKLSSVLRPLRGESDSIVAIQHHLGVIQHDIAELMRCDDTGRPIGDKPNQLETLPEFSASALEERLSILRAVVGPPRKVQRDLISLVGSLDQRTALLQQSTVNGLTEKFRQVSAVMAAVVKENRPGPLASQVTTAPAGPDTPGKSVGELLEDFRDREGAGDFIPGLCERLITLRSVYDDVEAVSSSAREISALRESTNAVLSHSLETLETLAAQLPGTAKQIAANSAAIQVRASKLASKIALLEKHKAKS
ncbi:hypothetical protein DIPPA_29619 [Diplonema papillatum]|nr:hypothetical protein DIPPA_29619 [Diplonema papillatum]|eukprot:gene8783-13607_t